MESDLTNTASDGGRGGSQITQSLHRRTTGPARRSTKGQWTAEEDEVLRKAVQRFQGKNWKKIAECFKDRTDVQCLHRWQKVLNPDLVKGPWSKEEDELISALVKKYGAKKWSTIARYMPGRIGKQCRERWHNHLNPNINKEAWTQEEEIILIRAHQIYGNKWAELMKFLPGRSDNSIKNHWNSAVKKKLDSYLASGLLAQFQDLPQIGHAGESLPSSSSTPQRGIGDDSVPKDGNTEAEEISECSREITKIYKRNLEEVAVATFPVQELPSEMSYSYSPDEDNASIQDWNINPNELPNISSMDLGHGFFMHSTGVNENNGLLPFPQQMSMDKPEHMIPEDNFFRVVYPDLDMDGHLFTGNVTNCSNVAVIGGPPAPLINQPLHHYQIPHFNDLNQFSGVSHRMSPSNDFGHRNDYAETILECDRCNNVCTQDDQGLAEDTLKLVPVGSYGLQDQAKDPPKIVPIDDVLSSLPLSSNNEIASSLDEDLTVPSEENDRGSLFYETPRFPSIDIPFFSCDLIQDADNGHQDYSPFGIRRLMMSSLNSLSPHRLWDSPTRDGSPCAVLKTAAKTFTSTPSILKKRNRDLLSPISEKRDEKRPETDMKQELFSDLARDFSRLDVMFFENENQEVHVRSVSSHAKDKTTNHAHDKENSNHDLKLGKEQSKDRNVDKTVTEDSIDENNFQEQPLRILVEQNMNDMFSLSPDRFGVNSESINVVEQCNKRLDCMSSISVVISPMGSKKKGNDQSHHLEAKAGGSGNDSDVENFILGDTPLKRSFESPSAWKSPWYFLPGPRVDTNITIEDFGYFLTPGNGGVDAVELMKQLTEQNADAFTGAQTVLGDDTPETTSKGRRLSRTMRNHSVPSSFLAPSVLTEKRVLDFSDCGTPEKEKDSFKTSTSTTISSPSSYMLKRCR